MRRRRHLRAVLPALAAACVLAGPAEPAQAAPTPKEKRLIARINEARADHGLVKLRVGPRIQRGAHEWARHLRRTDAFRHGRLRAGTSENIAWGTPCSWMSPRRTVRRWLDSRPHRRAMLRRGARYVGAGYATGSWRSYSCAELAVARFR